MSPVSRTLALMLVLAVAPLPAQQDAFQLPPETRDVLVRSEQVQARSALASGLPSRAIFHLEQALALEPRNGSVHALRGAALADLGRHVEAAASLGLALDLAGSLDEEAQGRLPLSLWSALRARALLEVGRGVEAGTELDRAVSLGFPADALELERAWAALFQGSAADAETMAADLLAAGDGRVEVRLVLAESNLRQDRPETALELLQDRSEPEALAVSARALEALGREGEAERVEEQSLEAERLRVEGRKALYDGVRALQQGDLEQAAGLLEEAVERLPGSADAEAWRGVQEAMGGRAERAEAAFRRALALDPAHPVALGGLADLRVAEGNLQQALLYMQAATRRDPDSHSAWMRLGAIYAATGRINEAMAAYRRAKEQVPMDATSYLAMAALQKALGRPTVAERLEQRAAVLAGPPPGGGREQPPEPGPEPQSEPDPDPDTGAGD